MDHNNLSDEELMREVSGDNLDALVPLFDRYQKPLYNFFLRLSSDPDASDDLVQNLFMRIMKYRKSFKSDHSFRTWIYQMGRNLYYDHYRKEVKVRSDFTRMEALEDRPDHEGDAALQIEEKEERLRRAIEQLPQDKREVLVMSKFQGMKYEEIARITNSTVSNIKVKVHRATNSLREIYFQTAE